MLIGVEVDNTKSGFHRPGRQLADHGYSELETETLKKMESPPHNVPQRRGRW
jgi:hypothetical protein